MHAIKIDLQENLHVVACFFDHMHRAAYYAATAKPRRKARSAKTVEIPEIAVNVSQVSQINENCSSATATALC
jgi:hypothetical protein